MAIVVNHNLPAMNANRMLNINNNALSKSLEKLSSGLKINRAADDASGLSISEKMRAQVRGLDQASANSEDGVSLIQTADGALDTTEQMLQRMRELTVKGTTETLADEDLQAITDEMKTLAEGINQIAERTEFNTKKLLTGNLGQTTVKATASFTTDEATTVSGTNLTATAGRTVSAGTTVKLTAGYTTNATDSAVKIVAEENAATVGISAGTTMTAGTTFVMTGAGTANKDVQLEFITSSNIAVKNEKQTLTAGSTLVTSGDAKFTQTVKVTSDSGTKVAITAVTTAAGKVTLTAGTTLENTAGAIQFDKAVTVKAGAVGSTVTVTLTATTTTDKITAGSTLTVTGALKADKAIMTTTGLVAAGASLDGKTFTLSEDVTLAGVATSDAGYKINLAANQSITVDADAKIAASNTSQISTTNTTNIITASATNIVVSAGGSVTVTANRSIGAGKTVETLVETKAADAGSAAKLKISVSAGGTVTITASTTANISAGSTYNVKTLYDGTTFKDTTTATAGVNVEISAGGSVTVTAGRTLTAGTTFQLGVDKQFATDAKVSGDKLAVSAGTTITAGTSYDTNNDMVIQTGANAAQVTKFSIGNMAFSAITTNNTGADITKTDTTYGTAAVTYEQGACIVASAITTETACSQETLLALDVAINAVSTQRSKLGAVQNQLEYTIKNLDNTSENLSSAESRIRDTDMAKEMMNYTKYNILSQASQSMLAQANQQPQSVLSLLQ